MYLLFCCVAYDTCNGSNAHIGATMVKKLRNMMFEIQTMEGGEKTSPPWRWPHLKSNNSQWPMNQCYYFLVEINKISSVNFNLDITDVQSYWNHVWQELAKISDEIAPKEEFTDNQTTTTSQNPATISYQ